MAQQTKENLDALETKLRGWIGREIRITNTPSFVTRVLDPFVLTAVVRTHCSVVVHGRDVEYCCDGNVDRWPIPELVAPTPERFLTIDQLGTMIGRKIKVVARPCALAGELRHLNDADGIPRGGTVARVLPRVSDYVSWVKPNGEIDGICVSGGWAGVVAVDPTPEDIRAEIETLNEKREALVNDLIAANEREAEEKKAAEGARFPLPEGWEWREVRGLGDSCAVGPHPKGLKTERDPLLVVYLWNTEHFCDDLVRVVARGLTLSGKFTNNWDSSPLEVVRAVIARYEAENAPPVDPPGYVIEIADLAREREAPTR